MEANLSRFKLDECNAKQRASIDAALGTVKPSTPPLESELHKDIEAELKRRRWYFCNSRMDRKTTTQLGVPDFVIAAPDGVTFWIEAKRKNGKLSPEQTISRHCLLAHGHKYATVFTIKEFTDFIDGL